MKQPWWGMALVGAVMCLSAGGCAPEIDDTPSPVVSQAITSAPEPSPTPSATPTPQWNGDEQKAIDAVQLSIATWNRLSQTMDPTQFSSYSDVAIPSTVGVAQDMWARWLQNGWHLVGDPYFIPASVSLGTADNEGQRFLVIGCYIIDGTDIVDQGGQSQSSTDRIDRGVMQFIVLRMPDGAFLEAGSDYKDGTC